MKMSVHNATTPPMVLVKWIHVHTSQMGNWIDKTARIWAHQRQSIRITLPLRRWCETVLVAEARASKDSHCLGLSDRTIAFALIRYVYGFVFKWIEQSTFNCPPELKCPVCCALFIHIQRQRERGRTAKLIVGDLKFIWLRTHNFESLAKRGTESIVCVCVCRHRLSVHRHHHSSVIYCCLPITGKSKAAKFP